LCAGPLFASESEQGTTKSGPVYVPLDSWVYPALKKLAAMGYVPDEEGLAAPWTRSECLMLVKEAEDIASRHSTKVSNAAVNDDAQEMIATLEREFADENDGRPQARIESIYTQLLQISGPPLQNSYHFGQTIVDNYGRPYETGTNAVCFAGTFWVSRPYPNPNARRKIIRALIPSPAVHQCRESYFSANGEFGSRFYTQRHLWGSRTSIDHGELFAKLFQYVKHWEHWLWLTE
jgi:hypothetical protein